MKKFLVHDIAIDRLKQTGENMEYDEMPAIASWKGSEIEILGIVIGNNIPAVS